MGVENVLVIKTKIQKSMKQCQNTGTSWWKQTTCMLWALLLLLGIPASNEN